MTNSVKIYPQRKKDQSANTIAPSEITGPLLSSTEEDKFFLKPLRTSGKDQKEAASSSH